MENRRTGAFATLVAGVLAAGLAGCTGGVDDSFSPTEDDVAPTGGPTRGGTLYVLVQGDRFSHLDPQRNYTGVDVNFASAFLHRTLTTYRVAHGTAGAEIVPDLATDLGTASDQARTWTFTLRDGVSFEDGTAITCADVKYGISRTFAQDVITDGPTYAISMLDIPRPDGTSLYTGPYNHTPGGQAAYDKAVTCSDDDKTITFHLSRSVPDFNAALTLTAFGPVPESADKGDGYDMAPVSSGPYKIETYEEKKSLVLVRNESWTPDSDPVRRAYPDRVVVNFSLNPQVIVGRLETSSGNDAYAVANESIDPADLSRIFDNPALADRRSNELDPFVRYVAINTTKVPELRHRQALMAALDREALLKLAGGIYAGDYADGALTPNLAQDYAKTGIWDGALGAPVPNSGNIELAKRLIAESGRTPPPIVLDYNRSKDDQTQDKIAAITKESWEKAGFTVKLNPIELSAYYPTVLNPATQGSASVAAWGPDWLNASTVIPELFTPEGSFALSRYDDPAFLARVADARTTLDRAAQATKWQALNKEAVELGLIIPMRFGKEQLLFGAKVRTASNAGKPYTSRAWGGPQFADLYLLP